MKSLNEKIEEIHYIKKAYCKLNAAVKKFYKSKTLIYTLVNIYMEIIIMTAIAIRQSGGANIISLPKAILKILGLHTGSELDLSIVDSKIVLTPVKETFTLEMLLKNTPKESLHFTEEDKEWLNAKSTGKEIE